MRLIGAKSGQPLAHVAAYCAIALPALVDMDTFAFAASLILAGGLIWASAVDLVRFVIPDAASLGLVVAGLIATWSIGSGQVDQHALAGLIGYLSLATIAMLFRRLRGFDGLGLGDAKLFAAAGTWLGLWSLPSVLLLAALSAIAAILALTLKTGINARSEQVGIAFGPFLAFCTWVVWLYGPLI